VPAPFRNSITGDGYDDGENDCNHLEHDGNLMRMTTMSMFTIMMTLKREPVAD
jgi:hypothetical protein